MRVTSLPSLSVYLKAVVLFDDVSSLKSSQFCTDFFTAVAKTLPTSICSALVNASSFISDRSISVPLTDQSALKVVLRPLFVSYPPRKSPQRSPFS